MLQFLFFDRNGIMKAIALIPHTQNVQLIDWPEPKIETPTQVKVRVLEVGICGTDREEVSGGRADAPQGEKQLIIGHEMLGEVVAIGNQVKTLKPKDLVVIMVRRPCLQCEMCQKGRSDFCETGNYTERGIKGRHGFHAEFVVDEEMYMCKVPSSIRSIAVMTEPTTVVEKAIDEAVRIQVARLPAHSNWLPGKEVLVAGLGPIGLLGAMILSLRGAKVYGMARSAPSSLRARLLVAMGGKYFQGKPDRQFDLILEAAGVAQLDFDLLPFLKTNGIYALTGVPEPKSVTCDGGRLMTQMVLKNQVLVGSVNASVDHFKQAILDLEAASQRFKGVIEQLITSKTPYAQFAQPLEKKDHDEIKAVIDWT